ncbi:MAG TPA: putative metal-binding motif-containing protein [Kofleriaceae bacterium]
MVVMACGDVETDPPDDCTSIWWYADCDGDGVAALDAESKASCEAPTTAPACGGGWIEDMPIAAEADCDDTKSAIHPGATEVCDMVDNDCDGPIDEEGMTTFYRDADGDGYGDAAIPMQGCGNVAGYVLNFGDCDDSRADVHPGATETCDLADNDCDTMIDDNVQTTYYRDADMDGHGNPAVTMAACMPITGYVASNDDCNDARNDVYPGRAEVCDGVDNNCTAGIDEGVQTTYYRDNDVDGYGNPNVTTMACSAPGGYVANNTDCNDARNDVYPGRAEVCDLADNNCNTMIDEGVQSTFYRDNDVDGYGNPNVTTMACSAPGGYVANNTDCNDNSSAVRPNATELCFNNVDDNCSGTQDEAAQCSIDCNWNGANWLSHGHNGGNMAYAGAWATCLNGKLNYMDVLMLNPPGWSPQTNPIASGTTDTVVGCNWGNARRWTSQGWDTGAAYTHGVDAQCSGGRVTSLSWEGNLVANGQSPVITGGQLGCDWNGAIYLTHGSDSNCAWYTGMVVTCSNSRITNFQWLEDAGCPRARD